MFIPSAYPEVVIQTDMKEKQGLGDCFTIPMQFLLHNIEQNYRAIHKESQIFLQACYRISSVCNESCKELPLIPGIIPQFNSLYAAELTQFKRKKSGEPPGEWTGVKATWQDFHPRKCSLTLERLSRDASSAIPHHHPDGQHLEPWTNPIPHGCSCA